MLDQYELAQMLLAMSHMGIDLADYCDRDGSVRPLWTPRAGPLDPLGRSVFIEQHALDPPLQGRIWDQFHAYPVHLGVPGLSVPDEYWPPRGPLTTRTEGFQIRVVPRAELAAVRLNQ